MKALFDKLCLKFAKLTTKTYSTSFSLGIKMLNQKFRTPIYNIYGYVRFADEIVDSFDGFDKVQLLSKFRHDTEEAIHYKISLNPILNSFQETAHSYSIEMELIDQFLKSMEMDLELKEHNEQSYSQYIMGSAEAVGLMCLRVFTKGDPQLYDQLQFYAQRLGAAFQKINFLRDMHIDYKILGRTYFPGVNFEKFTIADKQRIELEIQQDLKVALKGIRLLPKEIRRGVYMAYFYYLKLFKKIRNTSPQHVAKVRIRIPNLNKMGLMFESLIRHHFNIL